MTEVQQDTGTYTVLCPAIPLPPWPGFLATCSLIPTEGLLGPLPPVGPGAGAEKIGAGHVHFTHPVARLGSGCFWRSTLTLQVSPFLRECDSKIANKKYHERLKEVTKKKKKKKKKSFFSALWEKGPTFSVCAEPYELCSHPWFQFRDCLRSENFFLYLKSATVNITEDKKSKYS